MYDIREELMRKMVEALRKEQTGFEIMSDEEYYQSDYGYRRRLRNQDCANVVYMHCLVPGNPKNLIAVYFKKKNISIAVPMVFESFTTSIDVIRVQKDVYANPYLELRISRTDHDEMFEDTKKLLVELLTFAKANHFDLIW